MDNTKGWTIVIAILTLVSLAALGTIWAIYLTIRTTLQPVQSLSGEISTQVAQVLNPTPTILPDPITIIRDVRSLARLETIQYTVEKVITAQAGQGTWSILFGDKLIFVAHGKVIAGIDLAKMGPEDIWAKDGVLYVRLPEPEVFISALDNQKSYVYDRDTGLLTKGDVNLESSARSAAEREIEKAAIDDGILNLARQNGENYMDRLLDSLGYRDVVFVSNAPAPLPTSTTAPQP